MSGIWEVYDNEQVQLITRRQAAVTGAVVCAAAVAAGIFFILGRESILPGTVAYPTAMLAIAFSIVRIAAHVRQTSHIVWCVKISEDQIAGYDYARRETGLTWSDVTQIDVARNGLCIWGVGDTHIDIPYLFSDFSALSHRIVEYAERHHIPVLIDGQPVEAIDLYQLYPFLSPGVSTT